MPFPPPPPPRRKSGVGIFFRVILLLVLLGSLLVNVILLGSAMFSGSDVVENTLRSGDSDQKIAVVPVEGVITEQTAEQLRQWLKTIEADKGYKAVVVEINTPGGSVNPSDQIHHMLDELRQNRNGMPIAVAMDAMATSGGYYIACAGDYIVAQHTTLTGNIGVIMPSFNMSGLAEKWGVHESTITAPINGYKNAGSMFSPETPKDREYLQGIINDAFARFTSLVQQGRKNKLKGPTSEIFNGAVFTANQALKLGLIDEIGYQDAAYKWAATQAGLSQPMIVKFHRRPSLLEAFGARSGIGSPNASGKINVNIQLDAKALEELGAPQPMYLWRGQ